MATNTNTPPAKSTSTKNAAENAKEIKQVSVLSNEELEKKYSIAGKATATEKPGDLRAFHNFRLKGNGTTPRSFFMSSNDFVFSNTFTMTNTINNSGTSVQPIILNEFQPLPYRDMVFMLNDLLSFGAGIVNGFSGGSAGDVAEKIVEVVSGPISREVTGQIIKSISENPRELYHSGAMNDTSRLHPMTWVRKMFEKGKWLNTYELPFFGNTYLQAPNATKWSIGGLEKSLGGNLMYKVLKEGFNIDFPTAPQFQPGNMGENGYETIDLEFYLINYDSAALEKNFKFLHAFYAGTQWLQLPGRNN
jgi:hypothetical protein